MTNKYLEPPVDLPPTVDAAVRAAKNGKYHGDPGARLRAVAALLEWSPALRNAQIARLLEVSNSRVGQLRRLVEQGEAV